MTAGPITASTTTTTATPHRPQRRRLDPIFLEAKYNTALSWGEYLDTGKETQRADWLAVYEQVALNHAQEKLLNTFTRTMHLICITGIWCGDCVQQGPLLQRIAEGSSRISLRWLDRDEHIDLANEFVINAGNRIPVVLFLAEDFEFVAAYGDRSLTRYRALAEAQLGPSCPMPGAPVPTDQLTATMQDWLDEVERIQLLLRLSTRLRKIHND